MPWGPSPPQERQAFLKPYSQFPRFSDANGGLLLDEFIDAQEVVADLSAEYEACEHADYVSATLPSQAIGVWCQVGCGVGAAPPTGHYI